MAGNKSIQASPVTEYNIYLIAEIRMMRGPETMKKRFEKSRRYLVAQRNE
jgi:hypothetical protein